jgi:AcrR family transcriptional regulator
MARTTVRARRDADRTGADAGAAERRKQILTEAGRLFAKQGFEGTSMREIAAATGLLSGSLYYHFASKEELFVAVYEANIRAVGEAVEGAIEGIDEPWERFEAAAIAHCEALLTGEKTSILDAKFPPVLAQVRSQLIRARDEHERLFDRLIGPLDLAADIDRVLFRLHVLGALNSAILWYKPSSRLTPADVARHVVKVLRYARQGAATAEVQ